MAKRAPDYRDFKKRGTGPQVPEVLRGYWWTHPADKVHSSVFETARRITSQQAPRLSANLRFISMYGDSMYLREAGRGLATSAPRPLRAMAPLGKGRLTYNVCRVCVGTAAARIAKSRPKITALTSGGTWAQQQQAKLLDKFLRGAFYSADVPKKGRQAFRDGCVTDGGVLKVYRKDGRLCVDRVLPGELLVDDIDGTYGEPRAAYQLKVLPREVVMADYGDTDDLKAKIASAAPPDNLAARIQLKPGERLTDFVMVVEAWHLPSNAKAKDGRHTIALDNVTLVDEEWKRRRFPFVVFRWEDNVAGFWGMGLVEQVAGDQRFINRTLQTIEESLRLCSVPRIWLPKAAGIPTEHITNQIGAIGVYGGVQPPTLTNANSVPPELFQALDAGIQRALAKVGISQLSASGVKPQGLNSAVAIREQQDVETDRFSLQAQDYESMYLQLAEVIVDEAEAAAEDGEDIEVDVPDKAGQCERLSWKAVDLDREAFVLQLFPTSSLPQTPAARKQTVTEWQQAGWIDAAEARRLMDMPDLDASNNMALAAYEDAEAAIQALLDGGDVVTPEPFQDLALCLKRAQQAWLRARRLGAPKRVLDNLFNFASMCQDAMAQTQPPAPMGPAPQGAPPPGQPPAPQGPPMPVAA